MKPSLPGLDSSGPLGRMHLSDSESQRCLWTRVPATGPQACVQRLLGTSPLLGSGPLHILLFGRLPHSTTIRFLQHSILLQDPFIHFNSGSG